MHSADSLQGQNSTIYPFSGKLIKFFLIFLVKKRDQKNKNKKYGKKKPGRLGIRQRQQLEKQYHLRKEITQETMEEIAMELNLSFARVKVSLIRFSNFVTTKTYYPI